ncbi:MAG: glycosyl transferase family 2 [Flammeovirgaceae bacterium]|nr:glycosyl transferase family 2 [Flammeovirgaceae bacterium]
MNILIIIPVFNEENNIKKCIKSLQNQTYELSKIVLVNDGSTDNTLKIIRDISDKFKNIEIIDFKNSVSKPIPGKKIIKAFNQGLNQNKIKYDYIGKFDGDLILPKNYFEVMIKEFKKNKKLGLVSGVIASINNNRWNIEEMYDKDHVRGGTKLYTHESFQKIGGLKESIGWDTLDEMLLRYYGYEIKVIKNVITKQLRKTGERYSKNKYKNQGKVMYILGYDIFLAIIGSLKFSLNEKSIIPFFKSITSFLKSLFNNEKKIVNDKLATFVRSFRYKRIKKKLKF